MALAAPVRYRFAHFELQLDERRLLADGQAIHLGPRALDLLIALVEASGRLVTKDKLLTQVWGKVVVGENSVQSHISALRKALGSDAIATVIGQGYRFTLEVELVQEPVRGGPPPRHKLPQQLTSFIGREREIADIRRWLTSTRLVTLTGAGGCGKTRLALEVVGAMPGAYPDGLCFVELAPLAEPTLVAQAMAQALAIEAQAGQDIVEKLVQWLASRRLLLVLDNAEHLIEACADLADRLLRQCSGLTILATSRERLGIDGELSYRVPPLSAPESGALEDVLACEAVRLFVDRARLQRPDFSVSGSDAAALASICRRLDGIALAIELAAPCVRMMSLQALSARLDDRFRVLTGGSRAALPHHRTLRSLIDWSHALLSEQEQAVLRRASVFAGGWTLEAAERICSGDGVEAHAVLHLLSSLVDKNLVVTDSSAEEPRFSMLETVRHYARERLRDSGEEAPVNDRQVAYLSNIARGLDSTGSDGTIRRTLLQLDAEHDNLRAALAWCAGQPAYSVKGLRLASQVNWFWQLRAHVREGRGWLARLLAVAPAGEHNDVHAMALHSSAVLAGWDSDHPAAMAPFREAIALWRKLDDRRQLARSLGSLGNAEQNCENLQAARELYEEALAIAHEIRDPRSIAMGFLCLGDIARLSGDFDAARGLLMQGLPVVRSVGAWVTGMTLAQIGMVERARGDLASARAALVEALEELRRFEERWNTARVLEELAMVAQDMGQLAEARALLWDSLEHYQAQGRLIDQVFWLEAFAGLLTAVVDATCLARLWGCVERQIQRHRWSRQDSGRWQRQPDAARRGVQDDAAFQNAWNEGRVWSIDEAMRYARELDETWGERLLNG